jgi:beta-1,4-N-acetylglucosaminyltransferase
MNNIVVFVAGEGGHFKQFERIYNLLNSELKDVDLLLVTDNIKLINGLNIDVIDVGNLRPKSGFRISTVYNHFKKCFIFYKKIKLYDQITLISTGPGIALTTASIVSLLGGKIIHIETWSRFYSRSMTGRFMYYIADVFYIQNKSLDTVYPKSIYSGRL